MSFLTAKDYINRLPQMFSFFYFISFISLSGRTRGREPAVEKLDQINLTQTHSFPAEQNKFYTAPARVP